jgi:multifunctional beta-oxidation protein
MPVLTLLNFDHSYSLFFASRGANVVVNDVSKDAADKVVAQITKGAL